MTSKELLPPAKRMMIPEDWNGNEEKLKGKRGGVDDVPLLSKDYIYRMYKAFLLMEEELEKQGIYSALGYGVNGPVPDVSPDEEKQNIDE